MIMYQINMCPVTMCPITMVPMTMVHPLAVITRPPISLTFYMGVYFSIDLVMILELWVNASWVCGSSRMS